MKYHIITYGCQMNKSDSERMAAILEKIGYQSALDINRADLIIVNMCSVRQSAVDRVYGLFPKFEILKEKNPSLTIALTGCFLPADKRKMAGKFDLIFNKEDLNQLPRLLSKQDSAPLPSSEHYLEIEPIHSSSFSAYVPIMTGCNNFCAYCVVPYVRGREISRSEEAIIQEIRELVKKGYKEIILLGQNVNSYQYQGISFNQLLLEIDRLPGDFWIRFITCHPKDTSEELINTLAQGQKITEYLHLPVQAGDNEILRKMNRGYTREDYLDLIANVRQAFRKAGKDIAISTDIIVGFPGEGKQQFQATARLMKQVKFDMAYIARYSPRPQTAASQMKDDIPVKEKKRREKVLTAILTKTAQKKNKRYVRKIEQVLVERKGKNGYLGRSRTFKNVKIKNDPRLTVGHFYPIKIVQATPWGLAGELASR